MDKLIVTANKLNKRSSVPPTLTDKKNIVGVVMKGAIFLADEVPGISDPALGKWYKDRDGHFYWAGGVSVIQASVQGTVVPPNASGNDITPELLKQVFTGAGDAYLKELAAAFNLGYKAFSIDTPLRRAHFFAQMLEEVGTAASTKAENMNYKPESLIKTFGYFKKNPAEAQKYGRTATHAANQEAIASRAYANRLGNGNVESRDGWKYRGKGFIQLTGKDNYSAAQEHINTKLPGSGIDIVKNEDDILTVKGAMLSAMAFFSMNKIHTVSDGGSGDWVVDKVTAVVNKHTESYPKRVAHFQKTKKVFGLT